MGDPIPDGEALLQAAVRHRQSGQLGEARRLLERLLQLEPGNHRALHHLGIVLVLQGEAEPGIELIRRALAIFPNFPAALSNLGGLLLNLGRAAEALAELDKAVAIRPDFAEALYNRGSALQMLDRNEEAVEALDRTIAVKPDAEAYWLRGSVLHKLNRTDEALASLDQALALRPHYPEAEIARCMAELPILYEDESELSSRRSAYEQRLRALVRSAGTAANPSDYVKAISITPPFFLAYQGRNDRELQALYGSFVCAIMARSFPPAPLPPPPMDGEPVRVGIVSGCFKRHSNWKMPIKGWLSQLDRRRFRVFAYFTGTGEDDVTSEARGLCDRFVQGGGDSVAWWRSEILADAPHVLVYPEIGMNPIAYALAAMRLAPVQCNSWGHPNTSGFPTLDYYLSSDLMEPPDGQDHYTERLVRLPNLSVYCEPIERPPPTHPSMFNVPPSATVYWCCQS
ncbi:MAG TPA: tetratricopeptide repeat protein, partial [Stellaceae bacterium]|nr:tetratricopeptide repeat protein [Stellaceae bacterium]